MTMRNTLLVAVGFIALMAVVLIFFGDGEKHGMLLSTDSEIEHSESINDARQAFWSRDLPKAERIYRTLTSAADANINAWGELGNIYYMQARWKEAANAYTEVALRLIEKNELQQAAFFHRLVSQMDRAQSERINQQLRSLKTKQEG